MADLNGNAGTSTDKANDAANFARLQAEQAAAQAAIARTNATTKTPASLQVKAKRGK